MKGSVSVGLHLSIVSAFLLSPAPRAAEAKGAPELVSPVAPEGEGSVGTRCPTFSWTESDDARAYELVVYEVTDPRARERRPAREPVLRKSLPARASSWMPTLEECLPRAGRYGWTVGAVRDDGRVDWSSPGLFRVVEAGVDRSLEEDGVAPRAAAARARPGAKLTGAQAGTAPSNGPPRSLHAAAFDPPPCERSRFTDVPDTDPFCKWIHQLASDQISAGCGKGDTFCPDQPVTRRQIAFLLEKVMRGTDAWQPCTLTADADGLSTLRCPGGTLLRFVPRSQSVDGGGAHTCAVKTDGSVACWGDNALGQATDPVGAFTQVSAGSQHTCGLRSDDSVDCWGSNFSGQATDPAGPFTQVSAGGAQTCGLRTDGSVDCWGENSYGQGTDQAGPFTQVSAGIHHNCGIKPDGSVDCWGLNDSGQATDQAGPFTRVSAGGAHTCGLKSDGSVDCWGSNVSGQATDQAGPFTQVSAGLDYTCGIMSGGSVHCWGENDSGQATDQAGPFVRVSAALYHTCGVKSGGSVHCWGAGGFGQRSPPVELQ